MDTPEPDGRTRSITRLLWMGFAALCAALSLVTWVALPHSSAWISTLLCLLGAALCLVPAVLLRDSQLKRLSWFFQLIDLITLPVRVLWWVVGIVMSLLRS